MPQALLAAVIGPVAGWAGILLPPSGGSRGDPDLPTGADRRASTASDDREFRPEKVRFGFPPLLQSAFQPHISPSLVAP